MRFFSPANQLISHNGEQPIYLSCCVFYRGKTSVREVNATLERMRRSGDLPLVDWCPTGFKVGISGQPMSIVPASRIGQSGTSVVALHNSTLFRDPLHNLVHAFNMLIERRAFLHWFLAEGLEEDEFRQALEGIRKLEDDYTQFAGVSQDKVMGKDRHRKSVKNKATTGMEATNETGNHRAAPVQPADSAYFGGPSQDRSLMKKTISRMEGVNETVDLRGVSQRSMDSTYDRGNPQVSITLRVSHGAKQDMSSNRHRSTDSSLRPRSSSKRNSSVDETGSSEHRSHKRSHAPVSRDMPSNEEKSTTRTAGSSKHREVSSSGSRRTKRKAKDREVGEQKPEVIDLGGRELRYNETMEDILQDSFHDYQSDENYIERNNLHNDYEHKRFARQSSSEICDTENQTRGGYSQLGGPEVGAVKFNRAVIDRMNSASPALKKGDHPAAVDICQICETEGCAYCDVEYDEFHDEEKNDDSRFRLHHRRSHGHLTRKSSSRNYHRPSRTPSSFDPDPKSEHVGGVEGPLRAVLTGLDQLREVVTCLKRRL
uniref:Tubulin/FtsZ 2-layer sandwich domain-containing protein n=1 Tax=Schistocephalus solidus TaxID=70667 RepID=A0A0X3PTX4_SCHSO